MNSLLFPSEPRLPQSPHSTVRVVVESTRYDPLLGERFWERLFVPETALSFVDKCWQHGQKTVARPCSRMPLRAVPQRRQGSSARPYAA